MDFIMNNELLNTWLDSIHQSWGDSLSDEVIIESVHQASDFFNMNVPMDVHEDWTTGVITRFPFTENDDILVFNREQMQSMGITDKEGFDLVMTHEGAHRALQGLATGFNSHQEELCCDYMAGVRAGLNGMDEGKMSSSLIGSAESPTHPDGTLRVQAIEAGVSFAHEYMESHNGIPPSFSDCLEHFENSEFCGGNNDEMADSNQINLRPEYASPEAIKGYTQADIDWYEHQARISSGSEQAHWLKEAQWARDHISGFTTPEETPSTEDNSIHEFHGGQYGNATGDYVDDSHDSHNNVSFRGMFVDDRAYHLRRAQEDQEYAEWHHKRAKEAVAKGDISAARDHNDRASGYERSRKEHLDAAKKCTK